MITVGIFKGCLTEEDCRHYKAERKAILHSLNVYFMYYLIRLEIGREIKIKNGKVLIVSLYLSLGLWG